MIPTYLKVKMKNRKGEDTLVEYPAYLYGLLSGVKIKKEDSWHSLILVAGNVGSGKSTLVKGMAALDCHLNGLHLTLDDFHWSMDSVIKAMDSKENIKRPIIADEWIQSGGSRGFALTSIGNKLKIGFVTKRFKKNTYYLLADEIQEFPEKLIKMADAVIIVENMGLKRGFWKCFTNKNNIYFVWNGLKNMGKSWKSAEIRRIKPDSSGRFPDYSNIFVDEKDFDNRKMEETKQAEEQEKPADRKDKMIMNAIMKLKDMNFNQTQIAEMLGTSRQTIGEKLKKMTSVKGQDL